MDHPSVVNKPTQGDRILVVDDAPDNSFLIQSILREEGYQIEIVDNGKDALAIINESPPDLILLDVMMPQMDGFEVTRRIRENASLPFIPILLITAYDKPSVAQGLDTGADDFIRKPVELDELLARVRSLLKLKHNVDERTRIARQREDFVSRLTHDLRTPLVAADRMMSLMQQGALGEISPEISEALTIMARSNQDLLEMVNTLLAVYCYEAGSKTLSFIGVDLRQLLEEVIQALTPLALDKGLALKTNLDELNGAAIEMMGDRMELRRVFTNLVGNAIKFTDAGSVMLHLTQLPQTNGSKASWVKVEVEDTGPGIAPEYQSSLFEPFRHGNHKRSGSGLGLHLSSQIVNAHHGTISVRSELGSGCLFVVQLPTQQPQAAKKLTP
ncbi:hybrid sensor histidine kinase/response regulator [Oculatella sp. LEGE 06141]|uniref:sensor histidine kinase n=1 Tax=Oculatella sp. LEGE 06141 TaxID=1828648 RepID=UPI00188095E6|nr:hybrid sensor histidine kinase/response regulator [Oculatella sp. LEGE 06141]MBE9177109.1 hybrid sensor histidine kinase/response regulator [Oculatella sp. LEGE 06141]